MSLFKSIGDVANKALQSGANLAQSLEASGKGVPKMDIPYVLLQEALAQYRPEELAQAYHVLGEQAQIRPGPLSDLTTFLEKVYYSRGRKK